jgi:transcriptional regulator with PAS, ATPase and Fis domain
MPPIRLDDNAQEVIFNYRWPGNIRQLKNVTEQLSIIEQSRLISGDELKQYLPTYQAQKLPVIYNDTIDSKTFASEREILYKILFDMKQDMNELKSVVQGLMSKEEFAKGFVEKKDLIHSFYPEDNYKEPKHVVNDYNVEVSESVNVQDTEEFFEESLSIATKEIELIKKALDKHKGKRKNAAIDLGISERTLYRKINEYNLD